MAADDLVNIYSASDPMSAEIIKNFLEAEGIRCFIGNELQAGMEGISGMGIQILVPAGSADYARKLLEEHEPHKKKQG